MNEESPPSRDELVLRYTPLALRLARRFTNGPEPDSDLQQVALLGLVEAAERFDSNQGGFAAFAIPTITGTLKKHFRNTSWAVHVPRRVQENALTVSRTTDELRQQLRRAPTIAEIQEATGLTPEHIHAARQAENGRSRTSLSGAHDQSVISTNENAELRVAIGALPLETQRLLDLRYIQDLTQSAIAKELGISQAQVHRRLADAASQLRISLSDDPKDTETTRA